MQKAKYALKFLLLPLSLTGKEVFRQFIHSFNENILKAYEVPGTILGTGYTAENKIKFLHPQSLHSSEEDRQPTNKQVNK